LISDIATGIILSYIIVAII